ncbi:serine/threonine-protein kinase [Streptomyces indicus]|uniref:Serine/threonine protein kinase n=1 Tax=Streptomyces indicus TaxID=417292 RepID=A0A1G9CEA2_9ACTN|nr:serine/threonine-protein kinase [Streptomyces indicus]SDK49967.1 Serine/threonine protein kinase [Streptomyces indicus]
MESLGAGDPTRIGAYRLLGRLGAGGMGQVYLARSERGRTVAVKLVRQELAEQEEFRARFRQEVQAARRVGGQWTAPVLDADTEAAIPWVATGYVAGPSLQQVVAVDHGPLPERSVRVLATGLAYALKDIHRAGLIHRDLKPSNVLVTIDGPRVIDFGIARALETVTDGGLTRTGALVGSPGFMAPEQVRGDRITPACDVFCLGSVLAYAATGVLPFGSGGSGVHALMFRIAQEEPDLSELPEGLHDLIAACLHKDPAARPTLDQVVEQAGGEDTVSGGRVLEPWLPAILVAQLGRHAVELLDSEDPQGPVGAAGGAAGAGGAGAAGPGADGAGAAGAAGAASQDGAAPDAPPAPGTPGEAPLNHLPTVIVGGQPAAPPPAVTPPPAAAAPSPDGAAPASPDGHAPPPHGHAPAYGYPQPGPQSGSHSGPQGHPYTPGAAQPYGHPGAPYPPHDGWHSGGGTGTPPYGPPQPPPRRNNRATVLLVAVAVVVAVGAGGTVYAVMKGDEGNRKDRGASRSVAPTTPGTSGTSDDPNPPPTSDAPPTSPAPTTEEPPADGEIPEEFLGTWESSFEAGGGTNTRVLKIQQGNAGDTVMSLTGKGPTHDCRWTATLRSAGSVLVLGPSEVTYGKPTECKPGQVSELRLLNDVTLRRELIGSGGEPLTYKKTQ